MKARGAMVATLLGVMMLSALYPLRQYVSQDSHVNALLRQERELDQKIAALKEQRNQLTSDAEIERIAREELGMVRPGEVAFAVVPDGGSSSAPRAAAAGSPGGSDPAPGPAWHQRWWDAMTSSLRGMR